VGKADPLDAHRIAAAVLPLEVAELCPPRCERGQRSIGDPEEIFGDDERVRAALRVLVAARDHKTAERTATVYALIALLRVVDLGIDARRPLTGKQIAEISRWRTRTEAIELPRRCQPHPRLVRNHGATPTQPRQ
jgi:hypothetical protein